MSKILSYLIGIILLALGVYMSVILGNPHFYSPFSIGLFIITLNIYNSLATTPFFNNWTAKKHFIFWLLLIIASLIVDKIGLALNYWYYPKFFTLFDEILKITFEFSVSFCYFTFIALIGKILFNKIKINKTLSFILSFIIFVSPALIFTEYVNSFSDSWVVNMPLVIWFTIGAWLMALIPLIAYKITGRI